MKKEREGEWKGRKIQGEAAVVTVSRLIKREKRGEV